MQSRAEKGWGVKARATWKMTSTVSKAQSCNLLIISFLNDCSSLRQFSLINPDLLPSIFYATERMISLFKSPVWSWRTLVSLTPLSVFHCSWEKKNSACDLQSPSSTGSTTSPGSSHVPLPYGLCYTDFGLGYSLIHSMTQPNFIKGLLSASHFSSH